MAVRIAQLTDKFAQRYSTPVARSERIMGFAAPYPARPVSRFVTIHHHNRAHGHHLGVWARGGLTRFIMQDSVLRAMLVAWGIRITLRSGRWHAKASAAGGVQPFFLSRPVCAGQQGVPVARSLPKARYAAGPCIGFMCRVCGMPVHRPAGKTRTLAKQAGCWKKRLPPEISLASFPRAARMTARPVCCRFKSSYFQPGAGKGIARGAAGKHRLYETERRGRSRRPDLPVIGWYGDSLFLSACRAFPAAEKHRGGAVTFHPKR